MREWATRLWSAMLTAASPRTRSRRSALPKVASWTNCGRLPGRRRQATASPAQATARMSRRVSRGRSSQLTPACSKRKSGPGRATQPLWTTTSSRRRRVAETPRLREEATVADGDSAGVVFQSVHMHRHAVVCSTPTTQQIPAASGFAQFRARPRLPFESADPGCHGGRCLGIAEIRYHVNRALV
jgi:hypothetical protein